MTEGPRRTTDTDLTWAGFRHLADDDAGRSGRTWWNRHATDDLAEHGEFLGPADFVWCPEGLREEDAGLLGPVTGRRVLEVGCGAGQCTRWLIRNGAHAVGLDTSAGMLTAGRKLDSRTGVTAPTICADARTIPLADATVDVAFSAFGAIPFVPDATRVHAEVARVLRPGGLWVFAVTHPVRWAFPDDPEGLTAVRSYFDRDPYVETDPDGTIVYAEYHRTFGDHVTDVVAAKLEILGVIEPEWPTGLDRTWGGWGPVRGAYLPGTMIVRARRPDPRSPRPPHD